MSLPAAPVTTFAVEASIDAKASLAVVLGPVENERAVEGADSVAIAGTLSSILRLPYRLTVKRIVRTGMTNCHFGQVVSGKGDIENID